MAELARYSRDLASARRLYERARSHPACAPPWPDTIARALAELEARGSALTHRHDASRPATRDDPEP